MLNGIGFGKLAVIAFLLRIQERRHPKKRWLLYFVGFSGCVANFISTVLLLLQCSPLERQWNDMVPGSCPYILRTTQIGYFAGSMFPCESTGFAVGRERSRNDQQVGQRPVTCCWPSTPSLCTGTYKSHEKSRSPCLRCWVEGCCKCVTDPGGVTNGLTQGAPSI